MSPKKQIARTPKKRSARRKTKAVLPPPPPPFTDRDAGEQSVTIRTLSGAHYSLSLPTDFSHQAVYWEYVVRNRIRWSQNKDAFKEVIDRGITLLEQLGLDKYQRAAIAQAGTVEIDIPYRMESIGWELRICPWEFLLYTATVEHKTSPLIVVRHICCDTPHKSSHSVPRGFMVVESAPGELNEFSFESERKLVESNLGLNRIECEKNPTLEQIAASIRSGRPDVVHLAGVDAHQGKELLGQEEKEGWDGYFLSDSSGRPLAVTAEQLAHALTGSSSPVGHHHPILVSCNFYNSGARVAALIAAEAATASIGFQDEVDDHLAETFFAQFYFNWRALGWDLLRALRVALDQVELKGAIVVLWSVRSLLAGVQGRALVSDTKAAAEQRKELSPREIARLSAQQILDVKVEFKGAVNYSLLQNDEDLFKEFSVRKLVDQKISGVCVEVTLYVGSDSFPYAKLFDMEESIKSLAKEIRFPLTSTLLRSVRESINTVVSIKVSWNNQITYLDTKPLKLLAVDEWVDTPELDAYLPSFVFPRDRAVAKVIDSAQHYLMSLSDDCGAGFDGYQGVDPKAEDPFESVDLQARAIWSALSYDLPLSYINPPPTFTASSQRLRTPTDVIEGRRGTCIDLALLLAACLEYAGIYPVIFLLNDHAFPGYWRSEDVRTKFIDMSPKTVAASLTTTVTSREGSSLTSSKPWVFNNYTEITELVRNGDLVPIETVWLTQREGFWDAVDEGVGNLRSKREFSSLIDIQYARTNPTPVTPLPILGVSS